MAKRLGFSDAAKLLIATLEEENATDEKLTMLAAANSHRRRDQ